MKSKSLYTRTELFYLVFAIAATSAILLFVTAAYGDKADHDKAIIFMVAAALVWAMSDVYEAKGAKLLYNFVVYSFGCVACGLFLSLIDGLKTNQLDNNLVAIGMATYATAVVGSLIQSQLNTHRDWVYLLCIISAAVTVYGTWKMYDEVYPSMLGIMATQTVYLVSMAGAISNSVRRHKAKEEALK